MSRPAARQCLDDNIIRLTIAGVQALCDYRHGLSGGRGFGEDPFNVSASGLVSCRFNGMGALIIRRTEPAPGPSRRWSPAAVNCPPVPMFGKALIECTFQFFHDLVHSVAQFLADTFRLTIQCVQ